MNREIKFRAWDELQKKMFPVLEMKLVINIPNMILLQFTGLKDKNEVEIYEGDIVRSDKGGLGKIFWDKEGARFKVEWYKEDKFTHLELLVEACEVIGNIYENPELLTQNQDD